MTVPSVCPPSDRQLARTVASLLLPSEAGYDLYYETISIRPSALRHGASEADILHAIQYALFVDYDFEETDPPKVLILGPDLAGNLLEVVGIIDDEELIVFHTMPIRTVFLKLLDPTGRRTK